ncbi:MAG: hypothetical protein CVU56_11630 [Deltaproteobacteria bacterium HGW-Deltaproteobacteria-14]|jgi:hypothetical protein|nr:MAG: hypothetical protein CVU56_11630 [Deltaproteobacteria bacterium HGW-Deltaproteobacteria-14]
MRVRVVALAVAAVALTGLVPRALAASSVATLDIFALAQDDDGGQPLRAEGLRYGGLRMALDYAFDDSLAMALNVAGSLIDNENTRPLPDTVDQVLTTQASSQVLTLDAQAALRFTPPESPASFTAGLYYHHQRRFVSLGADLTGQLDLADSDTILALTYSFRLGILKPRRWDDLIMPFDYLRSHNLILSFTQNLSPSWLVNASVQYTRQDGDMQDAYNFVVLYDDVGTPVHLGFEQLPRERDRVQVSGRVRWSPRHGLGFGLDGSLYGDDWGVVSGAVEPSVEIPLGATSRWRFWYRFATQSRAKWFRERPTADATYQTQDFDLDAWTMHSPGMMLVFPLRGDLARAWLGRLSLFAFFRSDGISAVGANLGASAVW